MSTFLSTILYQFIGGAALKALQKFIEENVDAEFAAWFVKNLAVEAFGAMISTGDSQAKHLVNLKHLKATAITKLANMQLNASQQLAATDLSNEIEDAIDTLADKIKE